MNKINQVRVVARKEQFGWSGDIDFQIVKSIADDMYAVAKSIEMVAYEDHMVLPSDPTFTLDKTMAQVLMDELWNCGVRPTDGSGSAGSLLATEKHLNDMRKIVGKKVGVEL